MNRIHHLFTTILLLAVTTLTLGSCTDEYEYTPAQLPTGSQVFFSNELPTRDTLSASETSFDVPICRMDSTEALDVEISLEGGNGIFSIPSSVSFEAGQAETRIPVSYNKDMIVAEQDYPLTISVKNADITTPYGYPSYSFTALIPETYRSLGTGYFTDMMLITGYVEVEVLQNELRPNVFRVMHPYDEIAQMYEESGEQIYEPLADFIQLTLLQPGDEVNGVPVTQSDLVYFTQTSTGIDLLGLGNATYIVHPADIPSIADESNWTNSYVADYDANGLPGDVLIAPFLYEPVSKKGTTQLLSSPSIEILFPDYLASMMGAPQSVKAKATRSVEKSLSDGLKSARIRQFKPGK